MLRRRPRVSPQPPPDASGLFLHTEAHAPQPGAVIRDRRLWTLRGVLAAALLLLLGQSVRLQVASGFFFRKEAEGNRVRELIEYAPRGIFLDRTGIALVQNVPVIDLIADPSQLPDDPESLLRALHEALPTRNLSPVRELLERVARTHGARAGTARTSDAQSERGNGADLSEELLATAQRLGSPIPFIQDLSHEEFLAIASRADTLPGLRVEATAVRAYRGENAFAHVLGYTGSMSPEERASFPGYFLTEAIGKSGLERQYESLLRGQHGARRAEVDALGAIQHDLGRELPTPGANLRLHLDAGLQERLTVAMEQQLKTAGVARGAAIALDPYSGAVRALVSFPTYPQSALARGLTTEEAHRLLKDPASPLLNRVMQGTYVPGSTFKLAVAAGALEEGVATPSSAVESSGGIRVGQWFFPDWKPGGHGHTDLVKALAESVNTYFYTVGGGTAETPGLGIERLTTWAARLGFGTQTGIDLPEEHGGFLPSPAWKEQAKGEAWYIGDTYHAAIGQGDVLVTPLQLALATSVVANGGTLYAPQLLSTVEDSAGTVRERIAPVARAERVIRPETAAAIRRGMRAAVTDGSAQGLRALSISVGAKTGTAQVGGTERTHAWVTAFAPFEQPKLVLVVLLEQAGGGDRFAVPVARDVLLWYFSADHPAEQ